MSIIFNSDPAKGAISVEPSPSGELAISINGPKLAKELYETLRKAAAEAEAAAQRRAEEEQKRADEQKKLDAEKAAKDAMAARAELDRLSQQISIVAASASPGNPAASSAEIAATVAAARNVAGHLQDGHVIDSTLVSREVAAENVVFDALHRPPSAEEARKDLGRRPPALTLGKSPGNEISDDSATPTGRRNQAA